MHERGHNTQLMMMGPVKYLVKIGIPSVAKNDGKTPWELSASMLGGSNLAVPWSEKEILDAVKYMGIAWSPGLISDVITILWYIQY